MYILMLRDYVEFTLILSTYPLVVEKDILAFLNGEQHKPAITKALGEHEERICQFIREVISPAVVDRSSPHRSMLTNHELQFSFVINVCIGTLALPVGFFDRPVEILDLDGLKATLWPLKRDDLCQKLIDIVDNYTLSRNILLVRGPFASG